MAELGNIEFRDPQTGGGTGDRRDVVGALAQAGGAIVEARNRDILGSFRDDADQIITDVGAGVVDDTRLPVPVGDPVIDEFRNNMTRLRAAASQGSSNQKGRAELEIKRRLNQMEARFPRLRDELRAEFGAIARTDAGLDELGFRDVGTDAFNRQKALELKEITDYAHDKLGIPPNIPSDSVVFADEYMARSQDEQAIVLNGLFSGAAQAEAETTSRAMEGNWQRLVNGRTATIYSQLNEGIDQANSVADAIARAPNNPNTLRLVEEWGSPGGGRDQAALQVQNQIAMLELEFANVDSDLQGTPAWERIAKIKNDSVAHLQTLLAAYSDPNMKTAIEVFNTQKTIKQAALRAANPDFDKVVTFIGTIDPKYWETFGGENDILQNELGQIMQNTAASYLGNMFVLGGQGNPNGNDPTIVRRNLRSDRNANNRLYGIASTDDESLKIGGFNYLKQDTGELVHFNEFSTPNASVTSLNAVASTLDQMVDLGDPAPDQTEVVWNNAGHEGTYEKIRKAKSDPSNRAAIINWADTQEDFLQSTGGVSKQRELTLESLSANAGGVQARRRLRPNFDQFLEEGIITYSVVPRTNAGAAPSQFAVNTRASVDKALAEKAVKLGDDVSRVLRLLGGIQLAKSPSDEIDWMRIYTDNGFDTTVPLPPDTDVVGDRVVRVDQRP